MSAKTLLLVIIFFFSLCTHLYAEKDHTQSIVSEEALPFQAGETLHYKLSYRGILTSMIWADIADATMVFVPYQSTLDAQQGHQFKLFLSTENYTKAEIIQPVRYTYITTLDNKLQKTLQVEELDKGKSQSHDFLFLDWAEHKTLLYKKREKEAIDSDFLNLNSEYAWEADGAQEIPDFLKQYPLLENNLSYFIFDEQGDKISYSRILDPLSLIYRLRTLPENKKQDEMAIVIADDIYLYQIERQGEELIKIADKEYQTVKYKINSKEKPDNFFYVWISQDAQKLPVKMSMDAPLGKLEIDLQGVTQSAEVGSDSNKISLMQAGS